MSSAALNEPPVPHATLLLVGPVLMGALTSWMIFGISIVQLYIYHISFPNDPRWMQALVYWVFILDIFLTVVAAAMGWHILCAGWGRTTNLIQPGWTFSAIGAGDGIIATTVQIFYAWRIWVLRRWFIVPGLIVLIALAQLGSTLSIAAGIANLKDIAGLLPFFPRTTVWLGGGALADILIALSMVYLLTMARKNTRTLKGGDRAINRLIRLSVETGCLTAASAIIELGFFLGPATKKTNLHLFFALILGKSAYLPHCPSQSSQTLTSQLPTTLSLSLSSLLQYDDDLAQLPRRDAAADGELALGDGRDEHLAATRNFRTGGTSLVRTDDQSSSPVIHITSHTEMFADDVYSADREDKVTMGDDIEMASRKTKSDVHL